MAATRITLKVPAEIVIRNQNVIRPWCMEREISFSIGFSPENGKPTEAQFRFAADQFASVRDFIKSFS